MPGLLQGISVLCSDVGLNQVQAAPNTDHTRLPGSLVRLPGAFQAFRLAARVETTILLEGNVNAQKLQISTKGR